MTTRMKQLVLIIVTTLIILLVYGCFFRFHLVSDAYRIIDNSTRFIMILKLNEGRLVQFIYFFILYFFNISIDSIDIYILFYRINLAISIALLTSTVLLTYKILINNTKNINHNKKIIIFICSLLMFINISVSECMLYLENYIMILGLFLSVFATYIYQSDIKLKNIIIVFLILISSFCYQGVAQIFVILSALVLFLRNYECKQSYYLKQLFKILILYISPLLVNYLVCWIFNSILPDIDPRLFTGIIDSFIGLFTLKNMLVLFTYFLLFGLLIIFNLNLFTREKLKFNLLNIFYLMIISIISFVIFAFNNLVGLIPRLLLNFIIIYPVLKVYITNLKQDNKYIVDIVWVIILLLFNILLLINLQFANINSTKQNIEVTQLIAERINNYELENNIDIKYIAFCRDSILNYEYWNCTNILYFTYTAPIYYDYWCDIYSVNVLSGQKLNYTNFDDKIYDYFFSRNWDEPNIDEQLIFVDDTVYVCCF